MRHPLEERGLLHEELEGCEEHAFSEKEIPGYRRLADPQKHDEECPCPRASEEVTSAAEVLG